MLFEGMTDHNPRHEVEIGFEAHDPTRWGSTSWPVNEVRKICRRYTDCPGMEEASRERHTDEMGHNMYSGQPLLFWVRGVLCSVHEILQ